MIIAVKHLQCIFVFSLLSLPSLALAASYLGELELAEFQLQTALTDTNQRVADFRVHQTAFGVEWRRDQLFKAKITLGTTDLIRPHQIYNGDGTNNFGLVEGYLDYFGTYGSFRAGLIPLVLSYDSLVGLRQSFDSQSLMLTQAWLPITDYGFQYEAETGPFLTQVSVFEGGSGAEEDDHLWFSGLWAFRNNAGFGALFSGLTGRWSTGSAIATETLIPFEPTQDGRLRQGTIALFNHGFRTAALIESSFGKILQDSGEVSYQLSRIGFRYLSPDLMAYTLLVEQARPNMEDESLDYRRGSVKLSFIGSQKLSALELILRKTDYENKSPSEEEVTLNFRLSSDQIFP